MGQSIWVPGTQTTPALPAIVSVAFVKGAVATPGISWVGDLTTGIWSQANGYINFTVNGVNVLTIDPTGLATFTKYASAPEIDIASALNIDLGSVLSNTIRITGTSSINSFGINYKGMFIVRFGGACTLTNSASLIVPGNANLVTAIGDTCVISPKATGGVQDGWQIVGYVRASYAPPATAASGTGSGTTGSGPDALFLEGDQYVTQPYTVGQSAMVANAVISIATPAVILIPNSFIAGQPVRFTTTGALPTGLVVNSQYFVSSLNLSGTSFQVAATQSAAIAGTGSIATTGSQTGIHSVGKLKNAIVGGVVVVATGASITIPSGSRMVFL